MTEVVPLYCFVVLSQGVNNTSLLDELSSSSS